MENINVKLYEILTSGSDVVYRHLLSNALAALLFSGILEEGVMRNNPVKLFEFGPMVQVEMPFKGISYLEL